MPFLKLAHGQRVGHPAQLNPPRELQLLEEGWLEVEKDEASELTLDNFLCVSWLSHSGQAGTLSASEKRTISSKSTPQSLQEYSYRGIVFHLF
jgi:hypothetical protein